MPDFDPRPPSAVREESPFVVPPRVRVVAVEERVPEAVALAEELDRRGAEAEVRLAADAATDRACPDVVVVDVGVPTPAVAARFRRAGPSAVLIAVTDPDDRGQRRGARAAGFDLVVSRPVDPSALLGHLEERLSNSRA